VADPEDGGCCCGGGSRIGPWGGSSLSSSSFLELLFLKNFIEVDFFGGAQPKKNETSDSLTLWFGLFYRVLGERSPHKRTVRVRLGRAGAAYNSMYSRRPTRWYVCHRQSSCGGQGSALECLKH